MILKSLICRANWKKKWIFDCWNLFVFSEKCCFHRWSFFIYFYSVEPSKKTPVIFFHLLSRVKLFFFFSEKVGISRNCILTLFSTFLLFFFSEFILKIKNFLTFFVSYEKINFTHEKNVFYSTRYVKKINVLTCIVTSCIMYFFMYEADWKHFFLAETFFHGGIFFFFVCWAECKTFFFFLPFICL